MALFPRGNSHLRISSPRHLLAGHLAVLPGTMQRLPCSVPTAEFGRRRSRPLRRQCGQLKETLLRVNPICHARASRNDQELSSPRTFWATGVSVELQMALLVLLVIRVARPSPERRQPHQENSGYFLQQPPPDACQLSAK